MEYVILSCSIIAVILTLIVLVLFLNNKNSRENGLGDSELKKIRETVIESVNGLSDSVSKLISEKNSTLMNELNKNVDEMNKRIYELVKSQNELSNSQNKFKNEIIVLINENNKKQIEQINNFIVDYNKNNSDFNKELLKTINDNYTAQTKSFTDFENKYTINSNKQKEEIMNRLASEIKEFNKAIKEILESFDKSIKEKLEDFKKNTKESITGLSDTVTKNLSEIRKDNNEKLDKINESVNEKLQKTLEEKLRDSFKSVVEGIGDVNKAVGEIKGLATDVGSLKNVLTNVKTKGIMGEVILGNIIREFLTAGQFEENIVTKVGSKERVEFAIKLPGTKDDTIFLPVDSKFPYEAYSIINESSDVEEIKNARKNLRSNLLKYAKDVHDKYIDVPNTTDFAVIFLPLEGLYLEALNMGLFEEIQNLYKVNLTGPTTFTAFINSLNMGFKSLLIQKKSADVFNLLGAVKNEFGKFAEALEKTQKRVNEASKELDNLVGTRTRAMNRQLKTIDALDDETTKILLGESN